MNGLKTQITAPSAVRELVSKILSGILLIAFVGVIAFAVLFCIMIMI